MRYKTPEHVNKDSRVELKTTTERLLADISDKMQELINIHKAKMRQTDKPETKKKEKKYINPVSSGYQPTKGYLDPSNPPQGRKVVPIKNKKRK